jgi:hypothetical protein
MYDYIGNHRSHRNSGKSLEAVPGKRAVDSLQKTAVLETSHALQKVLQSET